MEEFKGKTIENKTEKEVEGKKNDELSEELSDKEDDQTKVNKTNKATITVE